MRCSERPTPTTLLRAIFVAPLARIRDAPPGADLLGVLAAAAAWALGNPLVWILGLYLVAVFADHILGAMIAHREDRYDSNLARAGVIGKGVGMLVIWIVRGIEHAVHLAGLPDTRGALALGLAVVLLVAELESVDEHRERLTGHPMPLLRPILDFFRRLAAGVVPGGGRE